jgi:hypothetical protein
VHRWCLENQCRPRSTLRHFGSPRPDTSLECCCPFIPTRDGRVAHRCRHRVDIPGRIHHLGRDTGICRPTGTGCRAHCHLPLDYPEPRATVSDSNSSTQSEHPQRCIRHIQESGALCCILQLSHLFSRPTYVVYRASDRMHVRRPTSDEKEKSDPGTPGGILGPSENAVHGVSKCNIVSKP